MEVNRLRLGFIGAGRLGTALAWSLARHGCQVVACASRSPASAERFVAGLPSCRIAEDSQELVDACDMVFITTPDGAIATVAERQRWRPDMAAVHCSAVTEVDALRGAARDGALIGGFHPMQTFSDPHAAMATLPGCTIALEAAEPLHARLLALVELLECRPITLPPGVRARYHAAGGYASQFVNVLLREASKIWQSFGATEEEAVRALLPLIRGTVASIESAGLAKGMPGPVSRGDVGSVEKHVAALRPLEPGVLALYRELCGRTVPMAIERGGIDEETALRIRRVLAGLPSEGMTR